MITMARELSRVDQGNGTTIVKVVLDNTTVGQLVVGNDMLDRPGYDQMLNLAVADHHDRIARRDAGGQ